ncbi:non-reducing end alpha-L-arabinofuranosidase family hydrolase [Clostridium saccharoperbutylacetonicum]
MINRKIGIFSIGLAMLLGTMTTMTSIAANAAANPNPTWQVGSVCFYNGPTNAWDAVSVKDPSIVYANGKYHLFYTGYDKTGKFQMGYASASTINGLSSAQHKKLNLNGNGTGSYGAPQVFYMESKQMWYLIYQGSLGACYATTTNIDDPNSWSGPKSLGASGNMGWDYWVICDDKYAYLFNTPSDGSHNIYCRKTSLANFPNGWGPATVAVKDTFEGACVYKSKADNNYYMLVEDMKDNRYYELHQASSLSGPWTKVSEKWASSHNLSYTSNKWTNRVSHGEILRSGINQKLEINDINKVDFLIQGSTDGNVAYEKIKWNLGIIKNYK